MSENIKLLPVGSSWVHPMCRDVNTHCRNCGERFQENKLLCNHCVVHVGIDKSCGVETHVESYIKDGKIYITGMYEIVDGNVEAKE